MAVHSFINTPFEVTEHILIHCHVRDVSRFSQTCSYVHDIVYNPADQYLWRTLFLVHPFDDLRKSPTYFESTDINWRDELQRRVKAELILRSGDESALPDALATFIHVVETALPVEKEGTNSLSTNLLWLDNILRKHSKSIESMLEPSLCL